MLRLRVRERVDKEEVNLKQQEVKVENEEDKKFCKEFAYKIK